MILSEGTVAAYRYTRGDSPLIVSMPHAGTYVPPSIAATLADIAAQRGDTDWHLPRLYDFLGALDATVIAANHSRYVADLNRPPDNENLYPGQDTTGLFPVDTFDRAPLYRNPSPLGREDAEARLAKFWTPYHRRLEAEIERVRARHGVAMLWDAHSIVSEAPRFFAGKLPDFNLGTGGGTSCDPALANALLAALARHPGYSSVLNGRFKGGYITRRYGRPEKGVQAVQMEMAVATYAHESCPFPFRLEHARQVRPVLREQLEIMANWAVPRSAAP